jgi:outer membrane lipoprotein LolB
VLGGCATPAQRPASTASIPNDLHELDSWQASGRLGVSGASSGGSGSFEWQQSGAKADVKIRGPVGIGSVRLEVEGEAANPQLRLQTGDGKTLESQAAWDELESRLGAPVPAGNLRYWMLGIAAPGEHTWHEPGADGVKTLEQGGWRIDYQDYSDEPGAHVPMKIRASSGAARVRIVVDRWRLGQ